MTEEKIQFGWVGEALKLSKVTAANNPYATIGRILPTRHSSLGTATNTCQAAHTKNDVFDDDCIVSISFLVTFKFQSLTD